MSRKPEAHLEDYPLLFQGAPSRLVVLEPAPGFTVLEATDAWLRSRRLSRDAVIGRGFLDMLPDEPHAAAMRASLARVLVTRAADEHNSPVFAADGRIRYIIHRDAVEMELQRSAHERDEAIAQLKAAKQELEAFAYSASHDLRAPLRAIGGYCGLLRNLDPGLLPPVASDLLARLEANVRTMSSILDGLLTLARVDTSRMSRRRVDVTMLAKRVVKELQVRDPERAVSVSIAEGLEVAADENLLAIALGNLIGNAWKYTSKRSEARIELGSRKVVGRDVFYVRDNGAGFDMARAEKLFTPFFRLHSSSEFEGHGIGLATVRRVVERHGGQVWAESEPGKGTTIHFTLR